jgi:peptide deformylase
MEIIQFGNPILRQKAELVDLFTGQVPIGIKELIAQMQDFVQSDKFGAGMSALQLGQSLAVSIIDIKANPKHNWPAVSLVLINPQITKYIGEPEGMWEGCFSFANAEVFAKAMRHKQIQVTYYDEKAKQVKAELDGFVAHVVQHEIDHLNGILFVDRVTDNTTFMNRSEYLKLKKQGKL